MRLSDLQPSQAMMISYDVIAKCSIEVATLQCHSDTSQCHVTTTHHNNTLKGHIIITYLKWKNCIQYIS
ncbi:hypothetical protein EB796_019283 [Bugula neritina]|uniref:Uncharacterized protein n=1 Tax=Bugula neritina TaxID=10212 RepID=A0A7J7J8M0_BUGNE|nr:hypothetical protein EB796_019283 [Bugula neritina]